MSYAFAKPTFGSLKEPLYQNEYVSRKKAKITYCKTPAICNKIVVSKNYDTVNSFNLGRSLETYNAIKANKTNLIMGQYTKSNLLGVCTVIPTTPCVNIGNCAPCENKDPVPLNTTSSNPFYWNNTIDPLGELFGNSQCGELNYTRYMEIDPTIS